MSANPYIAEIMPFASNFAVRGWGMCNGQLMAISSNSALFSILGTIYGGDGRTTFALPDLRGRSVVHPGNGPGLSSIRLGQRGGNYYQVLNSLYLPSHSHNLTGAPQATIQVTSGDGEDSVPNGNFLGKSIVNGVSASVDLYASGTGTGASTLGGVNASSGSLSVSSNGGNQSFDIRNPFLGINMEIALVGVYPSRN